MVDLWSGRIMHCADALDLVKSDKMIKKKPSTYYISPFSEGVLAYLKHVPTMHANCFT